MSSEPLDEKISFRITKSQADLLIERSRSGESPSKTAARVLANALLQSSLAEVLATLPELTAAAKALVEDVPGRLAEAILDKVSTKSAALISQKISDISSSQAARDEANRLVFSKILERLTVLEEQNRSMAKGVKSISQVIS